MAQMNPEDYARHATFRPSIVLVVLLLISLAVGGWWAVGVAIRLASNWSQGSLLSAGGSAPTNLLRDFIAELDKRDPDPRFIDELARKVLRTDLTGEMRSRFVPGWIDVMEALKDRDLLSPAHWSAYVEKFLAEAEQSAQPSHAVGHLIRYDGRSWLDPGQSERLLRVALQATDFTALGVREYLLDARRRGRIRDEDWKAMVRRTYAVRFVVRSAARLGASLPVRFDLDFDSTAARDVYDLEGRLEAFLIDGGVVQPAPSPGWPGDALYKVTNDRRFFLPLVDESGAELPVGRHTLRVRVRFDATPRSGQDFPPVEWSFEEERAFAVVPAATETVTLVTGLSEKLDPSDFIENPGVEVWKMETRNGVEFRFKGTRPPIAFSYDVYWKTSEEEVLLGSFFLRAATGRTESGGAVTAWKAFPKNIDVSTVDLILRPNRRQAEKEADCEEIYGEEIVLRKIPVVEVAPPERYARYFQEQRGR